MMKFPFSSMARAAGFLTVLVASGALFACSAQAQTPFFNFDFERTYDNAPFLQKWQNSRDQSRYTIDSLAHHGNRSYRIDSRASFNGAYYASVFIDLKALFTRFPNAHKVKAAVWVKTLDLSKGGVYAELTGKTRDRKDLKATSEDKGIFNSQPWTRYEVALFSESPIADAGLTLYVKGSGAVWFDDVTLEVDGVPYEDKYPPLSSLESNQKHWLLAHSFPLASFTPTRTSADLRPLRLAAEKAEVVGLGEATHGTKEHHLFRSRLTRYLVEKLGYRLVLIEANAADAYALNQYVLGQEVAEPEELLLASNGYHMKHYSTQEIADFLRWLRRYNQQHTEKVKVFGMDMQMNSGASSQVATLAAKVSAEEKQTIDAAYSKVYRFWQKHRYAYARTPQLKLEIDSCKEAAMAVVSRVKAQRQAYVKQLSLNEYRFLYYQAVTVWQQFQNGENGGQTRDSLMSGNVETIRHLFPDEKVALWAHNFHVAKDNNYAGMGIKLLGSYLKNKYAGKYLAIGGAFYEGEYTAQDFGRETVVRDGKGFLTAKEFGDKNVISNNIGHNAPAGSLEWYLHEAAAGRGPRVFDLRQATVANKAPAWLMGELEMRDIGLIATNFHQFHPVKPVDLFDFLVYSDRTSGAEHLRQHAVK